MARARKGGPKKKPGPRYPSGDLIPGQDCGTPELIARKIAMTGSGRGDLSSLGILKSRDIVSDEQYEAGIDFERCYRSYIGSPDPIGGSLERVDRAMADGNEDAQLRMKVRYWNCLAALNEIGPHVFNLVRDLCLYERSGGLMGEVITMDIRRIDGALIARQAEAITPVLRLRIGNLTKGLDAFAEIPRHDYSRAAEALIAKLNEASERRVGR